MSVSRPVSPSPADLAQGRPAAIPAVNPSTPWRSGTPSALLSYASFGKTRTSLDRKNETGEPDYLDRLADLAAPEDWDGEDANYVNEMRILRSYVARTFERVQQEGKIAASQDGNFSAFNTGLSTPRQATIYGLFQQNRQPDRQPWWFQGWRVDSDLTLLDRVSPLPDFASYTDNPADYVFDWRRELVVNERHIMEDNLDRFPKALQSDLYGLELRLKAAVEVARKRVRNNYKAAVPMWYPAQRQVQLLLPLSLLDPLKVDLALVVSVRGEYYRGDTVLTTGMAYNNARLLARPDGDWLRPSVTADDVAVPVE